MLLVALLCLGGVIAYLIVYQTRQPNLLGVAAVAVAGIALCVFAFLWPREDSKTPLQWLKAQKSSRLLGGLSLLVGVALAAGQIIPEAPDVVESTPTTSPSAPPQNCLDQLGPNAKRVTTSQVNAPPVLREAGYALSDENGRPQLNIAGTIRGSIPEGKSLYLLGVPLPISHDLEGNPGNGRYYPAGDITPTPSDGCFLSGSRGIAYTGSQGLVWRNMIALVTESQAAELNEYRRSHALHSEAEKDGYMPEEIEKLKIAIVATFDIPT
ncbi:hypothetical protein Aple_074160 [Acrocarpospora pleiomorpha]|uniref:Uncharacterized protein n=1 Tax=Acrocarpospora pleiomorpha TaxID=90975 RepID=A0A5M3XT97_9ACTN|nr:hypothetical protein [Acrocarpospora pleiomorpha]GES24517.1 hypothetical protein Aple_074160 [Acrocarpospora pleiomorpha]